MISNAVFKLPLDAMAIRAILPHRMPFLMLDRVIDLEPLKRIRAIKCVSHNEPYFQGHFPEQPVMPGVLMVEALAQAGAIMVLIEPEEKGKIVYLAGVTNFKFRRMVGPGDVLDLVVEMERYRKGRFGTAKGIASVSGEVAAEGELSFAVGDAR